MSESLKIEILPNNRYRLTQVTTINNPMLAALYGKSREVTTNTGTYKITPDGEVDIKEFMAMRMLLSGNVLFLTQKDVHGIHIDYKHTTFYVC